jgi:hypothetical protein
VTDGPNLVLAHDEGGCSQAGQRSRNEQ